MGLRERKRRKPVGGTIIVDVMSLREHGERIADPDAYRPNECGCCGHHSLHVHDYRQRQLRLANGTIEHVRLVRFACSECGAVWRVVPKFICARLRATWKTVQRAVGDASQKRATRVPTRTAQRWRARFASSARFLVVLLACSIGTWAERTAIAAGLNGTHADLLASFSAETGCSGHYAFAELATVLGRLHPGTCLMSSTRFARPSSKVRATPPEMAPSKLPRNSPLCRASLLLEVVPRVPRPPCCAGTGTGTTPARSAGKGAGDKVPSPSARQSSIDRGAGAGATGAGARYSLPL